MMVKDITNLERLIDSELHGLGFNLVGLEFANQGRDKLLRVYVDKISQYSSMQPIMNNDGDGGELAVNLGDCGKISYYLNKFLITLPELRLGSYILEVSSPGVDRKLFNLQQFTKQVGKKIKLLLKVPVEGRSNFIGTLEQVDLDANNVSIKVEEHQFCFDYVNVSKANVVYICDADKRDLK